MILYLNTYLSRYSIIFAIYILGTRNTMHNTGTLLMLYGNTNFNKSPQLNNKLINKTMTDNNTFDGGCNEKAL